MDIKQESCILVEIKTERIDEYNSEQSDHDYYGRFDQIEIGEEFKSEPPTITEFSDSYETKIDKSLKLVYCSKCNRSWKWVSKKNNSCHECNVTLQYKCGKCMRLHKTRQALFSHISRYCNNKKFKFCCSYCQYDTHRRYLLTEHIQAKHLPRNSDSNKCSKCGKSFARRSNLLTHSKICGQTKNVRSLLIQISCNHCNYKTNCKADLLNHIQAIHLPRDPNSNKCKKCGKIYSWRKDLQRKICGKTEEAKRSLMRLCCDYCDYKTNDKRNLSRHIQAKHLPRDPNLNKCRKCGKNFSQRSSLLRHLKFCGQTKEAKNLLMRFICDHCEYKTNQEGNLSLHIRAKHLPRDPNLNKCSNCGKTFSWRSNLHRHLEKCGQTKEAKRSLMRLSCDHCEYKTNHKPDLSRHISSKH